MDTDADFTTPPSSDDEWEVKTCLAQCHPEELLVADEQLQELRKFQAAEAFRFKTPRTTLPVVPSHPTGAVAVPRPDVAVTPAAAVAPAAGFKMPTAAQLQDILTTVKLYRRIKELINKSDGFQADVVVTKESRWTQTKRLNGVCKSIQTEPQVDKKRPIYAEAGAVFKKPLRQSIFADPSPKPAASAHHAVSSSSFFANPFRELCQPTPALASFSLCCIMFVLFWHHLSFAGLL